MGSCSQADPWREGLQLQDLSIGLMEQKELDQFLKENLETGRIRLSKSPMASPVFFIKKKDGTLWLVQDYQALNAMTVKNKYLLPLISELINKLRGAKYFTKLDVRWGQQCPDEGRRWVEGCIPNKPRTLWTAGYVFWTVQ